MGQARLFVVLTLMGVTAACEGGSSAGSTNAAAPQSMPDAVTADPPHYAVLFENDVARLLRIKYPVGAKSVMHSHPAGCGIILVDQTMKFTLVSGDTTPTSTAHTSEVSCFDEEVHLPENVGKAEAELILLELKNRKTFDNLQTGRSITIASAGNVPEAVAADPRHYAVQFENDVVRLVRIKLAAGEKSVMHAHPAHCVVFIDGGSGKNTTPDGKSTTSNFEPRSVDCVDAMVHLPESTHSKSSEILLIEFKNKQTFK